ncbi:MAG: hypothetical protein FI707_07840 [SAR202 cluster bacterium]|nr:hypothetical protein [SAR202 cluster bacterium]MQG68689.1 hypothetical protein [SAR202 cluster bacterium]HAL47359.1 hypothetical protein [Dehalococcoidia bacterium]
MPPAPSIAMAANNPSWAANGTELSPTLGSPRPGPAGCGAAAGVAVGSGVAVGTGVGVATGATGPATML